MKKLPNETELDYELRIQEYQNRVFKRFKKLNNLAYRMRNAPLGLSKNDLKEIDNYMNAINKILEKVEK
jgi:hypothetical protein